MQRPETWASYDERRRLGERGLQWFLGKRRIARGRRASVTGLPAGRRRLKVVARGAEGRKASASVLVRVVAVQPRLIRLIAPEKINRRARSVALRVAANVSARLTASGRRYAVGRRVRKIRVPVRRGAGPLSLRVKLT